MSPATLPAKAVVRLELGTLSSAGFTVETDAITLSFFCLANATTVTSSSSSGFVRIVIINSVLPLIATVMSSIPK